MRSGVLVALTTQFDPATLTSTAVEGLAEWRAVAPEQDPVTRRQLSRVPTSFGKFPQELAEALLYLGWWLCGAACAAYHREMLPARFAHVATAARLNASRIDRALISRSSGLKTSICHRPQLRHADGGALAQRVDIHQLPQTAPGRPP